jgi:hypothetical protein
LIFEIRFFLTNRSWWVRMTVGARPSYIGGGGGIEKNNKERLTKVKKYNTGFQTSLGGEIR